MNEIFRTLVKIEKDFKKIGTAYVSWRVEIELRNWGVKGVYVSVPAQTITLVDIEEEEHYESEDSDDPVSRPVTDEKEFDLSECEVDGLNKLNLSRDIFPTTLELYKGKWNLIFETGSSE